MPLFVSNVLWKKEGDEKAELLSHLGISSSELLSFELLKRSVDARRRPPVWQANYRVELRYEQKILSRKLHGVRVFSERDAKRYQKIDFDLKNDVDMFFLAGFASPERPGPVPNQDIL